MEHKKSTFSGSIGFVLAAAGSAVGVGNIWRFPYLAAKDGGGLFLLAYLILAVTFGFTLLATDVAIGRRTGKQPLEAYKAVHPKFGFVGKMAFAVPAIIITYYIVIGGWITKYLADFLVFHGTEAAADGYFTGFITAPTAPIVYMLIFLLLTAVIVYNGVEKGIERFSKIIMPALIILIVVISVYALTISHTAEDGTVRTGLQGLKVYLIPDFTGLTVGKVLTVLLDATGQLFFSLSVAMGIMVTYGSYVKKDVNLGQSVTRIEFFDTLVAFLAGLMIIPPVFIFFGTDGMASGPSLMFISLPKVFEAMGPGGNFIGIMFFVMVTFAALTSCVSILETLVASCMEIFHASRHKVTVIATVLCAIAGTVICMGYNVLYFDCPMPSGGTGQLLDIADYISNSFLMPLIAVLTCILIGWIVKPKWVIEEMESSGHKFGRKVLYISMIRYFTPVIMFILFLHAIGLDRLVLGLFQ